MTPIIRTLIAFLGLALCGQAAAQDYYGDIRPLLERKCVGCHSEAGVSFSFEDDEVTYGMRAAISLAVAERRMPPWLAEPGHQQYLYDPSLSDEERRLVATWAAQGYPKGLMRKTATSPGSADAAAERFEADLSVEVMPGRSYLPNQERKDDYRCFVIDWPLEQPTYITGFRALPGNLKVSHHLVLFAAEPQVAVRFKELEAAEPGLGYQCFGGAVPDRLGRPAEREAYEKTHPDGVRELDRANFWLAHWAPGMDGYVFPKDTGILIRPGMVLIAQMHYYSAFAPGEQDAGSRMQFQVRERVAKPALHYPLTRNDWLFARRNQSMVIAPGERARYEVASNLESIADYVAHHTQVPRASISALEVHTANLHMHSFGAGGTISLLDPFGRKETLLSVPRWDLNWQRDFTFIEPKRATREAFARTRLAVECVYENHTAEPVFGGFGSDEEMCFNFSYIAVVQDAEQPGQASARSRAR